MTTQTIYTLGGYTAGIVGILGYVATRYKLTQNVNIAPNTPEGLAMLLFFKLIWQVVYQCKLYPIPPPVAILSKPIEGFTNLDTATEAMGGNK